MTVRELIQDLMAMDGDAPVVYDLHSAYQTVTKVEYAQLIEKGGYWDHPRPYLPHEMAKAAVRTVYIGS